MSAEFYLNFHPKSWYQLNRKFLVQEVSKLKSFRAYCENIIYLKATNFEEDDWEYDVRMIFLETNILFELSSRNQTLILDLQQLFNNLRSQVDMVIVDQDDELTNW